MNEILTADYANEFCIAPEDFDCFANFDESLLNCSSDSFLLDFASVGEALSSYELDEDIIKDVAFSSLANIPEVHEEILEKDLTHIFNELQCHFPDLSTSPVFDFDPSKDLPIDLCKDLPVNADVSVENDWKIFPSHSQSNDEVAKKCVANANFESFTPSLSPPSKNQITSSVEIVQRLEECNSSDEEEIDVVSIDDHDINPLKPLVINSINSNWMQKPCSSSLPNKKSSKSKNRLNSEIALQANDRNNLLVKFEAEVKSDLKLQTLLQALPRRKSSVKKFCLPSKKVKHFDADDKKCSVPQQKSDILLTSAPVKDSTKPKQQSLLKVSSASKVKVEPQLSTLPDIKLAMREHDYCLSKPGIVYSTSILASNNNVNKKNSKLGGDPSKSSNVEVVINKLPGYYTTTVITKEQSRENLIPDHSPLYNKLPAYITGIKNKNSSTEKAEDQLAEVSTKSLNSGLAENRVLSATNWEDFSNSLTSQSGSSRCSSSASSSRSTSPSKANIERLHSKRRFRSSISPYNSSSQSRSRSPSIDSKTRSRSSSRSRSNSPRRSRSRSGSWSNLHSKKSRHKNSSKRSSHNNRRNHSYRSNGSSNWRNIEDEEEEEKLRQIEDRRVIYVGNILPVTTKNELRRRFSIFGPIEDIKLHFRDRGDNYGFITFAYRVDAYRALEHGNDDPTKPKVDLCFGGRRQFCKSNYSDLDSMSQNLSNQHQHKPKAAHHSDDFDSLLKATQAIIKKKHL